VRLALERRRRVKEQQKGTKSAEFRNTHFSYRIEGDSIDSSTVASCSPTSTEALATPGVLSCGTPELCSI
jgi:predicted ATP-dependent Lon-type protease